MSFKVAVASTDGITIDQHFGRSHLFYIYDFQEDKGSFSLIEIRSLDSSCSTSDCQSTSSCAPSGCQPVSSCGCGGGESQVSAREQTAEFISGCQIVLAVQIGPKGERALNKYNIQALSVAGSVDKALTKLSRFYQNQARRAAIFAARAR